MPYRGEIFALLTALCWTASSAVFAVASRSAGPLAANQFRLLLAVPVLLLLAWMCSGAPWPDAADDRVVLLVLSGIVGLVIGDIGFFHALAVIGPRVSSVVMGTWPVMAVCIALLLGEAPSLQVGAGVLLVVGGVTLVLLRSREGTAWNPGTTRAQWAWGVAGALLGACGQAGGVVLARAAMGPGDDLPAGVDPLQATVVRLCAAAVGLQLVAFVRRQPFACRSVLQSRKVLSMALLGCLFGPVLGVTLSMAATRWAASVATAASLMATTPIFMMPVARLAYGARIGLVGIGGTLLTVLGAIVCIGAGA